MAEKKRQCKRDKQDAFKRTVEQVRNEGANFEDSACPFPPFPPPPPLEGALQSSLRGGSAPRCYPLSFCLPFEITKWQIFLPCHLPLLGLCESPILLIPKSDKSTLSGGASPYTFIGVLPTPLPQSRNARRKDAWRVSQECARERTTAGGKRQTRKLTTSRTKNTWEHARRTSSGKHMGSTWQNAWELTRTENTGSKMETVKRVTEMREGKECGVDSGLISVNEYGR